MFGFRKEINPFSVSDKVRFRNIDRTITMEVRSEAAIMVNRLTRAQAMLAKLNEDSDEEESRKIALDFAGAIFGEKQANDLLSFYDDEPLAVIGACGKYFQERLGKIITKAQKREKK